MTRLKAYRVAVRLLGGDAYIVPHKRRGFVVGNGNSCRLDGVVAYGKTRKDAIRKAINKYLGVRL